MHIWVLQSCVLVELPGQLAPPYWGVGLLHVRVRSCVPPPQVTVHVPQLPHEAQLPSTKSLIVENISMENIVLEIWHLQILWNMNTRTWFYTYSDNVVCYRPVTIRYSLDMRRHHTVGQDSCTCGTVSVSLHRTLLCRYPRIPNWPRHRQLEMFSIIYLACRHLKYLISFFLKIIIYYTIL